MTFLLNPNTHSNDCSRHRQQSSEHRRVLHARQPTPDSRHAAPCASSHAQSPHTNRTSADDASDGSFVSNSSSDGACAAAEVPVAASDDITDNCRIGNRRPHTTHPFNRCWPCVAARRCRCCPCGPSRRRYDCSLKYPSKALRQRARPVMLQVRLLRRRQRRGELLRASDVTYHGLCNCTAGVHGVEQEPRKQKRTVDWLFMLLLASSLSLARRTRSCRCIRCFVRYGRWRQPLQSAVSSRAAVC